MNDKHCAGHCKQTVTIRNQVVEFHRANNHPVLDKPQVPADERVRLRLRLIMEETLELLQAALPNETSIIPQCGRMLDLVISAGIIRVDLPELADACADLDYVVEGTRLEFGIDGVPIAAEVHRSNMAKVGAGKREDDKALKPKGWKPPDIEGELRKQGWGGRKEDES